MGHKLIMFLKDEIIICFIFSNVAVLFTLIIKNLLFILVIITTNIIDAKHNNN